ncbi:hypothetical protein GSN00_14280 [Cylindrospermopsis raciborskii CHAB3438]|uniref:trypsin-like peptidase domain-containing protein n=1 Tax=Cylindrospermopsis raciborskii TaxID=77022 RepID=UPI0015F18349|nr:trypsin-like peptidase domain-containing protein [Cylindrospermopsis raciborskii]MCH4905504.1 hypothetical protein [Cylindrospermopsis raciborskii CHAB3438]UJL35099.1 trypsin-like peptidase domain-containing protein [Cylindrospermopsis raciborskii Cr2010]UJS04644.1 serine protease [Cylindrospermopsis raciborskii KLL07]
MWIIYRSNNGSGVIIAREGNTYTVLTSAHVVCKIPQKISSSKNNKNTCTKENYTVIAASGREYPLDNSSIKLGEGVDLATVKFNSGENHPVATFEISPEFASAYYERRFSCELGDENGAGFDFQRASDLQVSRPRILPKD